MSLLLLVVAAVVVAVVQKCKKNFSRAESSFDTITPISITTA